MTHDHEEDANRTECIEKAQILREFAVRGQRELVIVTAQRESAKEAFGLRGQE